MSANGSASSASNATSAEPRPGRFFHHQLRRASWISPLTGERSKRVFTLREASHRLISNKATESTPLLGGHHRRHDERHTRSANALQYFRDQWHHSWNFANSKTGRGIFKCSLAYFLGTLVTFVPFFAGLVGQQQDSKHMVATVTVWFHPARTIGSMHLVSRALLFFAWFLKATIALPTGVIYAERYVYHS